MADRGVFVAAFLTVVLVVAGAFALPELFVYQLLTSIIFVVIAVMVFFGDDKFSYMLGMMAPIVWYIFGLLTGGFMSSIEALVRFLTGRPMAPLETPLHGFAILASLALVAASGRAWRKVVIERFVGKTFALAFVVSLVWISVLAGWQIHSFSAAAATH
jgi:hypothetical protein